jgi:hypothetical protein
MLRASLSRATAARRLCNQPSSLLPLVSSPFASTSLVTRAPRPSVRAMASNEEKAAAAAAP